MRAFKYIITFLALSAIVSCQKTITADDANTKGMGKGAAEVLAKVKAKMAEIHSIAIEVESTSNSDMYGFAKDYEGTLKVEFGGKPGTIGNRWYESKQTSKGRTSHIRGVKTKTSLKDLYLLKKKVIKGDEKAYSSARVNGVLFRPYGYEKFFEELEGKPLYKDMKGRPTNTYLKGVENFGGRDCYVITSYTVDFPDMMNSYYFGVEDFLFYGNKIIHKSKDEGRYEFVTTITKLEINQPLPEFDVEVPEDFAVEMFVSRVDAKKMEVGMQAFDWTLPNDKGGKQTLSKEYAKNVILLDFWATWCGPCKAKMPHVQEIYEKYKDKGLKVISVLSGDVGHEKQAADYIKKHKYTFDLVFGTNELSDKYKIRFLPTVMLIDKTGKVIYHRDMPGVNDGVDEEVELEDAIKKALQL